MLYQAERTARKGGPLGAFKAISERTEFEPKQFRGAEQVFFSANSFMLKLLLY